MATITITSEIPGTVWKITAAAGQAITTETTLVILESMKMEIPIYPNQSGTVVEIKVAEGDFLNEGDVIAIIES